MKKRYPNIYRTQTDFVKRGKYYLTPNEVARLLDGPICVEEKIDGKLVESPQQEYEGYILFYEDAKRRHTVEYTQLPAWLIGIDVWDGERFLGRRGREEVFGALDVPVAPLLFAGEVNDLRPLITLIGRPSAYGAERIEGIVIKNPGQQMMGKIVDPVFDRIIDRTGHHLRRVFVRNRLDLSYV